MMRGHFDEIKNILSTKRKLNFSRTNNREEERLFEQRKTATSQKPINKDEIVVLVDL